MITNKPNRQNVRKLSLGRGLYKPYGQQGGSPPIPPVGANVTGSVDTDTVSDGTLYTLMDTSAADPLAADVKSGANVSQAVSGVTTQNVTVPAGSFPNDTYYLHYVQETTEGFSNVITSPPFLLFNPIPPVGGVAIYDGTVIQPDSVLYYAGGQHDGADNQASLIDSTASFPVDGYNTGFIVRNTSKATADVVETADITDTTSTTIVGSLSNAADWDTGNYYEVVVADIVAGDSIEYEEVTDQGGDVTMTTKGVPTIVGVSGTHTFQIRLHDDSDNSDSPWYLVTVTV